MVAEITNSVFYWFKTFWYSLQILLFTILHCNEEEFAKLIDRLCENENKEYELYNMNIVVNILGNKYFLHILFRMVINNERWMQNITKRSYTHDNHFVKLVILDTPKSIKLRFHIWGNNSYGDCNIHDHRWNFASKVICGNMIQEEYEETDFQFQSDNLQSQSKQLFQANKYEYIRKSNDKYGIKECGQCILKCTQRINYKNLQSYSLKFNILHKIIEANGYTLVMTGSPESQRLNCRLINVNKIPNIENDIDHTKLTTSEIKNLLRKAILDSRC